MEVKLRTKVSAGLYSKCTGSEERAERSSQTRGRNIFSILPFLAFQLKVPKSAKLLSLANQSFCTLLYQTGWIFLHQDLSKILKLLCKWSWKREMPSRVGFTSYYNSKILVLHLEEFLILRSQAIWLHPTRAHTVVSQNPKDMYKYNEIGIAGTTRKKFLLQEFSNSLKLEIKRVKWHSLNFEFLGVVEKLTAQRNYI